MIFRFCCYCWLLQIWELSFFVFPSNVFVLCLVYKEGVTGRLPAKLRCPNCMFLVESVVRFERKYFFNFNLFLWIFEISFFFCFVDWFLFFSPTFFSANLCRFAVPYCVFLHTRCVAAHFYLINAKMQFITVLPVKYIQQQ